MTETNSRPLNIILDVRVAVAQAATNYQAALHGLVDNSEDELRKEWHVQVLAYYREISRHSSQNNITDLWTEHDDDLGCSLADISGMQFKSEPVKIEQYDPRNKTTRIVERERIAAFEAEVLMSITAKLDKCVSALGFDADVKRQLPYFSYKEDDSE